jgi:phosphate transport system permease protein
LSTADTTFGGLKVRERLEAAKAGIRAVKRLDRVAGVLIRLGGIGIVVSVLGILLFIVAEAWPLFRPAQGRLAGTLALPPPGAAPMATGTPGAVQALGTDEYQMYLYAVRGQPKIEFFRLPGGAAGREFPLAALAGASVTAASRSLTGDFVAVGTADGRVAMAQVRFRPRYENQKLADLDIDVADRGVAAIDAARRPVLQVAYAETDSGRKVVAAQVGDDEIALWSSEEGAGEKTETLRTSGGERITRLALARAERLVAGTDRGNVYHWWLAGEAARLSSISPVSGAPVTALDWMLGGVTFIAGTEKGELSGWFEGRVSAEDAEGRMVRGHTFPALASAVRFVGASTRDKSFVTVGEDGAVILRHMTSERTLLALSGGSATAAMITPKGDGLLVAREDGSLARYAVHNPHPEVSWRALFGKVWYEGYGRPEYVWQSTGATNDFETKFSLVPLVFGTLKGTFYALLFAIPLAVMGALYTSQFVHPDIRGRIKPTVEVMAALPSVVIGFVAGLYLAPLVERYVVPILLMMAVMPAAGTAGVLLWAYLPRKVARRLKPGMELALILPLLLLGAWISLRLGPVAEAALFGGDFRLWLSSALGLTYDQRNSLVVGLAMGFAVIPIIFTIADDAFSSVPSHLTAGSLALGASRWQTALRVVVPTASPGVFSAIMIGFGRAVGETMIVLMATGNTPVLDWSIFNGMRTLSANIAVEIPEAPHGGTLYRILFLAAALLFTMTFVVNTVAEVVRQRLREKYRAL